MSSITRTLHDQARSGDREAYDRLFALHVDRALFYIRIRLGKRLRSSLESQDILQDAYLAAHRDFERFEFVDDDSFRRWLCRIIDNRIRDAGDYVNAAKRQPVEIPRSDPTGPVSGLERAETRETVARALEQLDDDHRRVILLRYFEGRTAEEAGDKMSRSAGAIRKLTARALVEMGKKL